MVALLAQLTALSQLIVIGWALGVLKAQLRPSCHPHRRPSASGVAVWPLGLPLQGNAAGQLSPSEKVSGGAGGAGYPAFGAGEGVRVTITGVASSGPTALGGGRIVGRTGGGGAGGFCWPKGHLGLGDCWGLGDCCGRNMGGSRLPHVPVGRCAGLGVGAGGRAGAGDGDGDDTGLSATVGIGLGEGRGMGPTGFSGYVGATGDGDRTGAGTGVASEIGCGSASSTGCSSGAGGSAGAGLGEGKGAGDGTASGCSFGT